MREWRDCDFFFPISFLFAAVVRDGSCRVRVLEARIPPRGTQFASSSPMTPRTSTAIALRHPPASPGRIPGTPGETILAASPIPSPRHPTHLCIVVPGGPSPSPSPSPNPNSNPSPEIPRPRAIAEVLPGSELITRLLYYTTRPVPLGRFGPHPRRCPIRQGKRGKKK